MHERQACHLHESSSYMIQAHTETKFKVKKILEVFGIWMRIPDAFIPDN
jgi:hypothetical protein